MRVMHALDGEHRLMLAWLREKMMFHPEPEGEMLLEILETASTEERDPPIASRRVPDNVVEMSEWKVGA